MYKVGDEVLIKAKIDRVDSESSLPYLIKLGGMGRIWAETKEILDCKTYEMGLKDAWNLAKKIVCAREHGGMKLCECEDVFDTTFIADILAMHTYEEALAKIEAYEKENAVCVGDVVKNVHNGAEYIVLDTKDGRSINTSFTAFSRLNICGFENDVWKKTGKHIDIESLLKQIGE